MYKVSETVLPIYINGQCPIIKTCSDVTLNLSSQDSIQRNFAPQSNYEYINKYTNKIVKGILVFIAFFNFNHLTRMCSYNTVKLCVS